MGGNVESTSRRRVRRRSPVTPITVEFLLDGYVASRAEVVDISAAGLGILGADGFGPGDGYDIRLACERCAHPPVVVSAARVVWCEAAARGGRRRGGLHFDRRHRATRLTLERLIQATCPAADEAGAPPER
jgi:hypothetical protein